MRLHMDKDALRAALLFLARTQLKGEEVDAFVTVVSVIKGLIDDDDDEEKAEKTQPTEGRRE